jgi:hypothetical protein
MPGRDGTGPSQGRGFGQGRGANQRRGGGFGMGASGECVCTSCGTTVPHQQGRPCTQMSCPNCGAPMIRK